MMYGKRITPVDYTLYRQDPPTNYKYVVRNCARPHILQQATENSPLYSSFSRDGCFPLEERRWPRRKDEFATRLASSSHRRGSTGREHTVDAAHCKLMQHTTASEALNYSVVPPNTMSTQFTGGSSAWSRSYDDFLYFTSDGNDSDHRVSSAPTLAQRIVMEATVGSRRPDSSTCTFAGTGLTDGSLQKTKRRLSCNSPLPLLVRVHHPCLLVRKMSNDPATTTLNVMSSDEVLPPLPVPTGNDSNEEATRHHDRHLLRLLRGNMTAC